MTDRILIVRPDRMGDVIISSACLSPLRKAYPDAQIYFCIQPSYHPLYIVSHMIDGVWDASMSEDDLVDLIKSHGISIVVILHPSEPIERAAARAGVAVRIGFAEGERSEEWLTHSIPSQKSKGLKHEGAYCFDLLAMLNVPRPDVLAPICEPNDRARAKVHAMRRDKILAPRFAVMHVGAHGDKPRLPTRYFLAVAEVLMGEEVQVVLVGLDAADTAIGEFLGKIRAAEGMLLNLTGKLALDELAWVLHEASVYFSRDTGPAHLAAAMKCPTVTIIPNPTKKTRARRWRPLGESSICIEKKYMHFDFEDKHRLARRHLKKVAPEEVIDSVMSVLRGS